MKASICVAVYNIDEKYLRECIESIIADKSPDIEIILGDDSSTNGSGKICLEYAAKDIRIKYLRAARNGGVSRIRNAMIDAACGEYITFVDGDDIVSGEYVSELVKFCENDYDIIMFQWRIFEKNVPETERTNIGITQIDGSAGKVFSKACLTGAPPQIEKYGITNCTPSSVCTKAYHRSFIIDNGIKFKPGLKKSQDVEFNTEAFFMCQSIGYLPKAMYMYRTNPSSVCHRYSGDLEIVIDDCIKYDMENMKRFFPNDSECAALWRKYKLIFHIISNFELNIFHRDNPNGKRARKADFLRFVSTPPFARFFDEFDFASYEWNERRLVLRAAKARNFALLDFLYRYPLCFKIYGKVKSCLNKLSEQ